MKTDPGGAVQIPLLFNRFEQISFALFEPGRNGAVLTLLESMPGAGDHRNVYLWGQAGCGKTHLLQALCCAAAGRDMAIAYVPLGDAGQLSPELLEGLEELAMVCVDDIDAIAGQEDWEEALFGLYNRLRDAAVPLVMTAGFSPRGNPVRLPDLKSRLGWDHVFHLLPLDDAGSLRALRRRAQSRGFDLPEEVAAWLVRRVSRDMHSLFGILDRLDRESLAAKKKLTVPFVRDLLD